MKITHLIAAGLMVAGLGVSSTAASAQDYRGDRGYDQRYDRHDDRRDDRGYDRRDDRGYDRRDYREHGRHYGWNGHQRRCTTQWRHHRRVTVCYR